MEFKISVDELQSIFSRLASVVKVNEEDVTGMILIDAGEKLKFKVTNGGIKLVESTISAEIIDKGKSFIRFRDIKPYIMKFMPLVEGYGTENYHFIINESGGVLKTKTRYGENVKPVYRKLKFQIFNNEVYPPIKDMDDPQLIVNSSILKRGIGKVLHCINPAEIRKTIAGLNMTIALDKIVFSGTNGVKLSEFTSAISADIETKSYILKYNFASILKSVLDDDAQVFMKFERDFVYVKSNNIYLIGNLETSGDYPDYKPMFSLDSIITVPRLSLYDSVHTVMDVLDAEDNRRLTLIFSGNKVSLKNDVVESEQEFDVQFDTELDVDVNGEFLDSILRDFMSEFIEIHFGLGNHYIVLKASDNPNQISLLTIVKRR